MAITIFENEMRCLFCDGRAVTTEQGGGFICAGDDEPDGCGAYYFVSGIAAIEKAPEWYEPDGEIEMMQEANNGVTWHWCRTHRQYEPDTGFPPRPCGYHIERMTLLLSGGATSEERA